MLDSGQRERNYIHQTCCEPTGGHCRDGLTPAQARRLRKKVNKAKGDASRSRKQRWLTKLQTAIEERRSQEPDAAKEALQRVQERRAARDPHSAMAQEIASRSATRETVDDTSGEVFPDEYYAVADKDGNPIDEVVGKSLCPQEWCDPSDRDMACRTKSGKKTKDHAGRVR